MAEEFYKGHDTYIIYGEETAYGTLAGGPSASNRIGEVQTVTTTETNNFFRVRGLGNGRNATSGLPLQYDVSLTVEWLPTDISFLQYAIGETQINAASGPGGEDVTEVIELERIGYGAGFIPTLQLEIGSEGGSNDYLTLVDGAILNNLTINLTQSDVLRCTADILGRKSSSGTTIETYTPGTAKPFYFGQGSVTFGSEAIELSSLSLTIANTASQYWALGDRFKKQPTMGDRTYDFTITLRKKFDDTASTLSPLELKERFFGAAAATEPINGAQYTAITDAVIKVQEGTSTGDRAIWIELENGYLESWSEPVELGEGVIEMTVNGFFLAGKTSGSDHVVFKQFTYA